MKFSTTIVVLGALAAVRADDTCISTCESTAASSLSCDASDLSGCFCLDDFAKAAKACLYENDSCGKTYVSEFYNEYNSACASVSTSSAAATSTAAVTTESVAATTTFATVASTAASATSASSSAVATSECISTCEETAASSLSCDVSDLSSCFCLDDFASAAKSCLYGTSGCGKSAVSSFYESYNSACASVSVATSSASNGTATATTGATASSASASYPITSATSTGGADALKVGSLCLGVVAMWGGIAALF